MLSVREVTDLAECQAVWRALMPAEFFTDLWEVRACFDRHFARRPTFLVAEDGRGPCGLLPLSWVDESGCFGYFPGETWHGKTWLEQNRIIAPDGQVLSALLEACPDAYHIRYLLPPSGVPTEEQVVDEQGFLFLPPAYGYDFEEYLAREFSPKAARKLLRAVAAIEDLGVSYRFDDLDDFDSMVALNIERFGDDSYFSDRRFRESFRDLMRFLYARGRLRMTTVLIGGEPAAVDMGCLFGGVYTLVAGGTHAAYRGVAKVINLHHMRRACRERMQAVDFLCGAFSWKPLLHLAPRPLMLLTNADPASCASTDAPVEEVARVL
jgi:hypothetical protein